MTSIFLVLSLLTGEAALAHVIVDDCFIQVGDAHVEAVPLINPITRESFASEEKYLILLVVITNRSDVKKIDYQGAAWNRYMSHASLRDDLGNSYKRITFGLHSVAMQQRETSIYPGKTVGDLYIFEPPVEAAKMLTFTIAGEALQGDQAASLSFPIPRPKQEEAPAAVKENTPHPDKTLIAMRTWKISEGLFNIEAEFRGVIGNVVSLKKKDGTVVKVSLEKLSDEDRRWIKNRAKKRN